MGLLSICGALAAGEYLASFAPEFAPAWPVAALAALLTLSLSLGLGLRMGCRLAVFFLGVALFLGASLESERLFREKPWLRARRARSHQVAPEGLQAVLRADFRRRVSIGLEHDRAAVSLGQAILLGERAQLPRETWRAFVASGSVHVFAISGLHVVAVIQTLAMLLMVFGLPRRIAGAAAIPLLWGYVWLIGLGPSAVRAAIMATIYFLAPLFWRRSDALRAWALAFLAVHLVRPLMIVNVGSALSFSVMLAIVLTARLVRDWPKVPAGAAISLAAWAAGVPISAHVFGRLTPGGLLANVVMIAGASCSVVAGVTGLAASFVSPALAAHFNNLSALVVRAMVGVSNLVARLPGANVEVERWSVLACAAWYALGAAVALVFHARSRRLFG